MNFYDVLLAKNLWGGGGSTPSVDIEPLSVTENGVYTAPGGKAYSPVSVAVPNSYGASDEGKVVSNGALISQTSQSIDANGVYDTTLKNSVTVNVSGGGTTLIDGAIRPDAELWKTYSYDKNIVQDGVATIPTYSTSSVTVIAQSTIDTIQLDFSAYHYIVVANALTIPKYGASRTGNGTEYTQYSYVGEIMSPISLLCINGQAVPKQSEESVKTKYTAYMVYSSGTGSGQHATSSTSYGIKFENISTSISSSSLTIKSPTLSMRGNTTQMTQSAWESLEDVRIQYLIKVYRVPLASLNVKGYELLSMFTHVQECIANGGTLT